MSEYIIQEETLTNLADKIREKTGNAEQLSIDDMINEIDSMEINQNNCDEQWINRTLTSVVFPYGITTLDKYLFYNCTNLALTELPAGITSIGSHTFDNCTNLASLTFKGTPTSIADNAFFRCTNLTTINVPWAEGELEGAPWGANNATINYNYTGV